MSRSPRLRQIVIATIATLATAAGATMAAATPVASAPAPEGALDTSLATALVKAADGGDANRHLVAFQRIADRNGGNRAANTPGYDASVKYVAGLLRKSGYSVRTPTFTYDELVGVDGTLAVGEQSFALGLLNGSDPAPAGGVTAPLAVVPEDETTGCEATDFEGADYTGTIAVVRRGACTFLTKAQNAAAAGAVHVIITNSAAGGDLLNGTLGEAAPVPVGFTDFATGDLLAPLSGQVATANPSVEVAQRTSRNIIAQTRKGRTDNVVMAGAHLDSVEVGPGINDNGSGSAGLLEVALELGGRANVKNAVRFGWWGAEEIGLLGSQAYVDGLSFQRQLDIALYLNFDMIGSPNAAYFVYDGDDSDVEGAGPGPYGSAQIENTLTSFLAAERGIETRGTDFSGRSDYGGFIAVGIPSGGLFSGAEGIKTADEAALWGGSAGVAYDPCYHAACDNLGNIDRGAFDANIDAIAWSTGLYATSTEDLNGVPARAMRAKLRAGAIARSAKRSKAPMAVSVRR